MDQNGDRIYHRFTDEEAEAIRLRKEIIKKYAGQTVYIVPEKHYKVVIEPNYPRLRIEFWWGKVVEKPKNHLIHLVKHTEVTRTSIKQGKSLEAQKYKKWLTNGEFTLVVPPVEKVGPKYFYAEDFLSMS